MANSNALQAVVPTPRNRLVKLVKREYIPGSPGIPSSPGQPYRPARREVHTRTVCEYGLDYDAMYQQGWQRVYIQPSSGSYEPGEYVFLPPTGVNTGTSQVYTTSCRTESYEVVVPEQPYIAPTPGVPPIPSQTIIDFNLGWTGRARSMQSFSASGTVKFKASSALVGAVVGLNNEFHPSGFADIKFAFRLESGVASIVERGQQVAYIGPYADGAEFSLTRHAGKVSYRIDGVQVWESQNNSEPMHLDAVLYSGDDSIYDPAIYAASVSSGHLQPLSSYGRGMSFLRSAPVLDNVTPASLQPLFGEGWGGVVASWAKTSLLPIKVFSRAANRGDALLHPFTGLGSDTIYGESRGTLSALVGGGEQAYTPRYALANTLLGVITGAASGLTGGIGGAITSTLPLIGLASDRVYGESRGSLQGFYTLASGYRAGDTIGAAVSVVAAVFAHPDIKPTLKAVVVFSALGQVSAVFSPHMALSASAVGQASGTASFSALSVNQAQFVGVGVGGAAPVVPLEEDNHTVWVVNAETGASTRYENYPFNSFAFFDGAYYGCRSDGIYRLEGDTDNGAPIQAMMSFGKRDFGTSALKQVTHVYAGLSSGGRLFLKTIVNGEEFTYVARTASEDLRQQRFDLGRGLRANYLEFELYNADGDDFELASVEFLVVPLNRRI